MDAHLADTRGHLPPTFGKKPLASSTVEDIDRWVTARRQQVAPSTLNKTLPLLTISTLLSLKSLSMTARYTHLNPQHLREAMRALERPGQPSEAMSAVTG